MRLLAFVAVLVTARAATLIGQDKCTWGPSYWCTSLEASSHCQNFQHCLDTIWKQKVLAVEKTPMCSLAQKVVDSVKDVLPHDDGKEEASGLIASMCPLVKEDDMRKKCKTMVTEYLPEVYSIIESGLDSASISTVLGFCQLAEEKEMSNEIPQTGPYYPPINDTMCADCRAFIGDVATMLYAPGAEDKFVNVMEDIVCSELGDLAGLCKAFLEVELPNLFKFVADNDNPETVCRLATFCVNTVDEAKPKLENLYGSLEEQFHNTFTHILPEIENKVMCHECNKMLSPVLTFDKESRFTMAVENTIYYLCSKAGLSKDKCMMIVEGFIPKELGSMLSRDYDAQDLCKSTLKCVPEVVDVPTLTEDSHPLIAIIDEPVPTSTCNDCIRFFADTRAVLRDNISAPEAAAMAKQSVCQQAGPLEFECNAMMDVFMPVILQYLARVDSPQKVCGDLTLCAKSPTVAKFDIVKFFDQLWDQKHLGSFECDECTALVQEAREADRDPTVQNAITGFFNKICDVLGSEASNCKSLVQQYSRQLFEIIASEMEPDVVCELLLRCTKPEVTQKRDEPVIEEKPETVNIIAQEEPVQVEHPYKKSKENSAIFAKKDKKEHQEKVEEEEEHLKKKTENHATFVAHISEKEEPEMNIGKALEAKVGASVKCAICRLAMESLDVVIAANATQQEVENGLKELCKVLPSSVREPCDDFINTYTPALVDLILQELDPFMICNELGVCNSTEAQLAPFLRAAEELKSEVKKPRKEDTTVGSTFECLLCELIVGTVDSFIGTNRSEAAIQSMLDGICDLLPKNIDRQCRSFVDEYTVVVVQLLLQEMDPEQVCIFIKVCQSNSTHTVQEKAVGDDLLCSLCDIVIGEVAYIIGDNKSEPAVKSALEKVCGRFPVTIRNECVQFVDTYAPAIINLLVQEIDPHKICKLLGICKSTKEVQEKPVGVDFLCSLCDIVIGEVAYIIGDNKSEPAVKSALEKVCGRFPLTIRNECVQFVDTYAPDIINLLVQEIDPHKICKLLGLCKSTKEVLPEHEEPEVPEAGPLCSLCEGVMNQLEDLLGDNRSEAAIESALDKVCNFLPAGDKRAECISIIQLYVPAIINLLIQEVQPKEICQSVGLCTAERVEIELPTVPTEPMAGPQEGDDFECKLCKAIISTINGYIKENRSEAALIHAVEVVCDFMSGDLKLQCKSEVENYGPAVLDLLAHMDDPLEVCKAIKLCLTSNDSEKKKINPVKLTPGEECLICQTLAGYAEEALNDPNTANEVENILKGACNLMPSPAKDICIGIVVQFTPQVLARLAEMDNPLRLCQEIDMCSKDNVQKEPTVVGADPCTYGPAFWCANMDNAKKCQVVDDCINKYGMKPEPVYK